MRFEIIVKIIIKTIVFITMISGMNWKMLWIVSILGRDFPVPLDLMMISKVSLKVTYLVELGNYFVHITRVPHIT